MQEQTGTVPPALERRPILTQRQQWLAEEFSALSRDRRYTAGGPAPLHTGAIRAYYDAFQLHDFDFDDFYAWMVRIDSIWLSEVTKRQDKELKSSEAKSKSLPPSATPR